MTRLQPVAGLLVLAVVAAACAPAESPGTVPDDAAGEPLPGRLVVSQPPAGDGGMDAIVGGVVEVDLERGCVWLSDEGGSRYPVVWPAGTTGRVGGDGEFEIVLAGGTRVRDGDRVRGAGGYVPAENWEQIPAACVQAGEVAVFNGRSEIEVEPGAGLELAETLVGRLPVPASLGLELIAVNPSTKAVVVVDLVEGTVHRFGANDYVGPADAIAGMSGGGGFIHLWSEGTVWSYPGGLTAEPLVYQPDPLVEREGVAGSLRVVPAVDGEHTWLVQPGEETTWVELVNLVEEQLARLGSFEVEGKWLPVGATTAGLVMISDGETLLVGPDGATVAKVPGTALSVGWNGAALVQPEGTLVVVEATLADQVPVQPPAGGVWTGIGGPVIPADAPPIVTGGDRYLLYLADDPSRGAVGSGSVVMIDGEGVARVVTRLGAGSHAATWSRDGEWVAVVDDRSITLFPVDGGDPFPLGDAIPPGHWVITAG